MLSALIPAAANIIGGIIGQNAADDRAAKNEALQREFAQSGIQWKVADAKKAGIHPLYALGAQTHSFAPQSVGSSPMASAVSAMGQDIGRAVHATQTQDTREQMFRESVRQLELTNYTLKNDLLASQIAKLKAAGNPPMPPLGTATEAPADKLGNRGRNVVQSGEVRGHPGYVQTNAITDEYGEGIGDWLYGPLKLYMDWAYHRSGAANQQQYHEMVDTGRRRARERSLGGSRARSGGGW